MKLEVGMYVRFNYHRVTVPIQISKIKEKHYEDIERYHYYLTDNGLVISEAQILKASHNIIDLIEVGDIISYEYPTGLGMISYENVTILPELLNTLQNGENNHEYKIKSIVTHEQFSAMEYKVESEVK